MSKKNRKYSKLRHTRNKKTQRQNSSGKNIKIENRIIAFLHSSNKPVTISEIAHSLPASSLKKHDIQHIVDSLLSRKILEKAGKKLFTLGTKAPLYEGIIEKKTKGFGFLVQHRPLLNSPRLAKDPFISTSQMGLAHHGDKVLLRILKTGHDGRTESVVVKILSHGKDHIAGFYHPQKNLDVVYPEDPRLPFDIVIHNSKLTPNPGDAVIVKINRSSRSTNIVSGEIIEILGNPDSIDVQMRLVIEKFSLPHIFSETVFAEAQNLSDSFELTEDREDLRKLAHVTIDGETAKDFDDAICIEKTSKGFQLYVSIADVSHFVQPGSALDKEAYSRGTSIYFPGRVIPMLPERLSNDICSLVPNEDRFTVSAILNFDLKGKLLDKKFTKSVIRSHHRFTYTTVKQILIDKDPEVRHQHKPFLTQLKWAEELATALYKKRRDRGAIGFNVSESNITLTETGEIKEVLKVERNFAHQIIEEFMLAANEAVAELFTEKQRGALYRVHEKPDFEKVSDFFTFAKTLDIAFPPPETKPEWFAKVVDLCRGTKPEYVINNLLLRTMKQAQYSPENTGHFGLASTNYTHFTSPIRRYPDLEVHRELIRTITEKPKKQHHDENLDNLTEKGTFLSARERVAVKAEREITSRLKVRYMSKRIGDTFDGIISGVSDFAMFVEIPDLSISGSIGLDMLTEDYYIFDKKLHRLIGELSGTTYQIGDAIKVTLVDVDHLQNRINFARTEHLDY